MVRDIMTTMKGRILFMKWSFIIFIDHLSGLQYSKNELLEQVTYSSSELGYF